MATAAERMRAMRVRQREKGLRQVRLLVPDTRDEETRARIAAQVRRLSPAAEKDALDWIEQVSVFDEAG